jgi:hypothetical protein
MFGEVSEGVNWIATGAGGLAALLLGRFWLAPGSGLAWAWLAMSAGLLAWVMGLAETRQALLPMLVVVAAIAAFVVLSGVLAARAPGRVVREALFVPAAAVLMFVCHLVL